MTSWHEVSLGSVTGIPDIPGDDMASSYEEEAVMRQPLMRRSMLSLAAVIGAVLAGAATPVRAQQATTIRASSEALILQVQAGGVPMRLKIIDGEMGRISVGAFTLGLTPRRAGDALRLVVFEVLIEANGAERIREIAQSRLHLAAPVRIEQAPVPLEVQWLDASKLPPLPPGWNTDPGQCSTCRTEPGGDAALLGPCVRCCVACDGVTACACEVWMSCGHCCCDSGACGQCIG